MGGSPVTAAPPLEGTALLGGDPGAAGSPFGASCPNCGAQRDGRFCEECGFDYELAELLPSAPAGFGSAPAQTGAELNGYAPANAQPANPLPTEQPAEPLSAEPLSAEPLSAEPMSADPGSRAPEVPGLAPSANLTAGEGGIAAQSASQPSRSASGVQALSIVVTADHEYYAAQIERGDIVESEFPFPKYPGERRFALDADVIRIGRASASRGIAVEIDLTGPPLDPAVSHLHAQLSRGEDGGWRLVDLGSANGTRLNGAEQPLPVETEVPVRPGDRIHL